jgi:hypothetical protein
MVARSPPAAARKYSSESGGGGECVADTPHRIRNRRTGEEGLERIS